MKTECVSCGRVMKIQSRGMCTACYRHQLFIENPAYAATSRAQARESKRQRRREDAEWAERERERDTARRRAQGKPPRGPGLTDMPCSLCGTSPCMARGLCRRCYNRLRMQAIRAADPAARGLTPRTVNLIRVNSQAVRDAKSVPCTDCGGEFPWWVMDLDHVRGDKKFSLSKAASRKPADVLEEIAKCDAVCANCHRIRTHARGAFGGVNSPLIHEATELPEAI